MDAIRQAGALQRAEYVSAGGGAVQQRSCLLQGVQCDVLQGTSMSGIGAAGTGDCLHNLMLPAHPHAGAMQQHCQAAWRALQRAGCLAGDEAHR